jgi:hypothetical protein
VKPRTSSSPKKKKKAVSRRPATLSLLIARELDSEEALHRNAIILAQLQSLCDLQTFMFRVLTFEKNADLITACVMAADIGRALVVKEQGRVWERMVKQHVSQLNFLRSQIPLDVINKRLDIIEQEEEMESRKTILFLENKVIRDVCEQVDKSLKQLLDTTMETSSTKKDMLSRLCMKIRVAGPTDTTFRRMMSEYSSEKRHRHTPTIKDPRHEALLRNAERIQPTAPKMKARAAASECCDREGHHPNGTGSARSTVNVMDGCPFLHLKDCPFREAEWVNPISYKCQHVQKKYVPIKPAANLAAGGGGAQETYAAIEQQREELLRTVRTSLYIAEGRGMKKRPLDARFTRQYLQKRPLSAAGRMWSDESNIVWESKNGEGDEKDVEHQAADSV